MRLSGHRTSVYARVPDTIHIGVASGTVGSQFDCLRTGEPVVQQGAVIVPIIRCSPALPPPALRRPVRRHSTEQRPVFL